MSKSSALRTRRDPPEILDALKIEFLSSVDRPAMEDARALLMKRAPGSPDPDPLEIVWKNGTPGVLTSETDGHTHIVWLHGMVGETTMQRSPNSEGHHDHPWTLNPDGSVTVGANDGHDHSVPNEAVMAAMVAMQKRRSPATPEDDMDEKTLKALEARIEKAEARAELAETNAQLHSLRAGMTDAQLTHFDGLEDTAKAAFASKSRGDRDVELEEIETRKNDADPILFQDGDIVVRKSDGGTVLALARKAAAAEKRAEKAEGEAGTDRLRKRADEELAHLPGTTDEKVELLKGVETIPEGPGRDAAMKALTAGNEAIKAAYDTRGGQPRSEVAGSPEQKLEQMAKNFATDNGVSQEVAYAEVLKTEEGSDLYAASVAQ